MTRVTVENEQQCSISLSEFRLNRLQLNETPFRFLEANYDIEINKQTCFLKTVIYNYGYKDVLILERLLERLSGDCLWVMKLHQSTCHDSKTGDSLYKTNQ